MTILQDLAKEITGYAKENISLEIINFQPTTSYGTKWDVGDMGTFQVRINNKGNLHVKNVKLHLNRLVLISGIN